MHGKDTTGVWKMRLQAFASLAGVIMAASFFGNAEGNNGEVATKAANSDERCLTCVDELSSDICKPMLEKLGELEGCQTMTDTEEKKNCMAKICLEDRCLGGRCQKTCDQYVQSCPEPVNCEDTEDDCEKELERVLNDFWQGEECHLEQCKKIVCRSHYFVQKCRKTCQPHTQICSGECIARKDDSDWCHNELFKTCPYGRSYIPECEVGMCNERPDYRKRCPQLCNPGCTKDQSAVKQDTPIFDFVPKENRCFESSQYCADTSLRDCDGEVSMRMCPKTCHDPKCSTGNTPTEGTAPGGNGNGGSVAQNLAQNT